MKVKEIRIDELKPNDYNPNVMSDDDYGTLVRNIKEYGMLQPLLVRKDNVIIDGFHRWKASKEAGLEKLWCVVIETDEEEAKLRTLEFNNIRGNSDREILADVMEELINYFSVDDITIETGYNYEEIKELFVMTGKDMSIFDEIERVTDFENPFSDDMDIGQEEAQSGSNDDYTVSSMFGSSSIKTEDKERIQGLCDEVAGKVDTDERFYYTSIIYEAVRYGLEVGISEEDIERILGGIY